MSISTPSFAPASTAPTATVRASVIEEANEVPTARAQEPPWSATTQAAQPLGTGTVVDITA